MIKQWSVVLVKDKSVMIKRGFLALFGRHIFVMMICLCQLNNILSTQIANNCRWKVVLNGVHCYRLCETKIDGVAKPTHVLIHTLSVNLFLSTGLSPRGEEQCERSLQETKENVCAMATEPVCLCGKIIAQ